MKLKVVGLLITSALFVGCSSGSSGGGSSTAPSKSVFEMADSAFSSTANMASSFSIASLNQKSDVHILATCDANGRPTSTAQGSAVWAKEWAYCALSTNSFSPDTVQGSYWLAKSIMCALDKKFTFVYNTTPTLHENINISATDDCFSDDPSVVAGGVDVAVRERALSGADYD